MLSSFSQLLIRVQTSVVDQSTFCSASQLLDFVLTTHGRRLGVELLDVDEFDRCSSTGVFRALAAVVFVDATLGVGRIPRIQRLVGTANDIDVVVAHNKKQQAGTKSVSVPAALDRYSVPPQSSEWSVDGSRSPKLAAGSVSGSLGNAGVGRTGRTGKQLPELVGKHPREAVRNVRPTMVAT